MPHDQQAPPAAVEKLYAQAEEITGDLLIGCDANCRHMVWGSTEINDRGESLFDYITNKYITICNQGNILTFVFPSSEEHQGWEEVLDLTLQTGYSHVKIRNWKVAMRLSFLAHMYLLYGIDIDVIKTDRSPRKTDWNKFAILVQSNVKSQCKKENLSN